MKREDLLSIKVAVEGKSAEVQEALFRVGFKWINGVTTVIDTEFKYIYVDSNGYIMRSNDHDFFKSKNGYREVPLGFVLGEHLPECDFKPFDKVLVRNSDNDIWRPAFFSRVIYGDKPYTTIGNVGKYTMCVAYEGNEELVFTRG